ncbi:MAG: hypothetical protein AAF563_06205 [Pseudomonadota bacterium]
MLSAIRRAVPRIFRNGLLGSLAAVILASASAQAETLFVRIPTQYIAALGDSSSTSGTDAGTWGLWPVDPGPRGVWTTDYDDLVANEGVAPSGWQFNSSAWWLEENGLIMEAPRFPLPAGQYVVTGGRDVTSVLTVEPADETGTQAWSLADGATIYDVTHLGCRAALYTARSDGETCTPDKTPRDVFPMSPGVSMPTVDGCDKRDYQVLIVVGMLIET